MYLDVFTLSALVDEFMDTLVGGRVQDVLDVDQTGIGLEIYADRHRRYLYLSADPQTPRIHLLDEKLRRGLVKPTQVGLLFRRFVEGGLVTHVSQPPWEQIIQIDVQGPEGDVSIVVEPMERRSNLLLIQKGVILGEVTGAKKQAHAIDATKCNKCGKCFTVCNLGAIQKV